MHVLNRDVVRRRLKGKGYRSAQQLARRLGVHRNTLTYYLSGAAVLPRPVEDLLALLELPLNEALVEVGERDELSGADAVLRIVDQLHGRFPSVSWVLFGSRARGTHARYADLDLGVYAKAGLAHDDYRRMRIAASELAEELPVTIDLVNLNRADRAFLARVVREGRLVAGRLNDWLDLTRRVGRG